MKKILSIMATGLLFCALSVHSASAATISNGTNAGAAVTITSGVAGAPNITFNPSTNVFIDGASAPTSFAVNAWHEQAAQKTSGQRYGMAADSNKMFFQDISTTAPTANTTSTNSSAFSGWHTM